MKRIYKISINVLMFGWILLVLVNTFSSNLEPNTAITLSMIAMAICLAGGILSLILTGNNDFWKSLEELEELKQEYRESIVKYNKVKEKLINKILENEKNN